MAKKQKPPSARPRNTSSVPDAKIGLGRVIRWVNGICLVRVELLDENGYHCVGVYELVAWVSPPPDVIQSAGMQGR